MSTKRIPFPRRRSAALVGVGLMLAQLASAGQPARVHFGYENDADDLCLMWDRVAASGKNAELTGHLYHKEGGVCGIAPLPVITPAPGSKARSEDSQDAAPIAALPPTDIGSPSVALTTTEAKLAHEPVVGEQIRIRYETQASYSGADRPEHVTTDEHGIFHVTFPAPSLAGGVTVTAAYYGEKDESGEPLVQAKKKLATHIEVETVDKNWNPVDRDSHPEGPQGTYYIHADLVDWSGRKLDIYPGSPKLKLAGDPSGTGVVMPGAKKDVKLVGRSVTGVGSAPGVAAVKVVTGEGKFESEPFLLPFGVNAKLERVDEHKDEEIILQRPDNYNGDEGQHGSFFDKEHAQLKLTLTSLLSGKPLKAKKVNLAVSTVDPKAGPDRGLIEPFLSEKVEVGNPSNPSNPSNPWITEDDGTLDIPVSARHFEADAKGTGSSAPGAGPAYEFGVGKALVMANINGQVIKAEPIEFIDSLWLKAHPAEGAHGIKKEWAKDEIRRVDMIVDGYVGVDGKSQAKRKFVPFHVDDHSVAAESDAPLSSGPVYFASDVIKPVNTTGEEGNGRPGLAYREKGPRALFTGYFQASDAAKDVSLEQEWPVYIKDQKNMWWGQAGVTLEINHAELTTRVIAKH